MLVSASSVRGLPREALNMIYIGPNGTDGSVFITGKRPDTGREFKIQLRMACPFAGLNVVEVKSDAQPVLLVGAGELKPDGHPMICK